MFLGYPCQTAAFGDLFGQQQILVRFCLFCGNVFTGFRNLYCRFRLLCTLYIVPLYIPLSFPSGERQRKSGSFCRASDRYDGSEFLLILTDVVLQRSQEFLCLVRRNDYTGHYIRLRYTGHELSEVKNELSGSMCDKR